MARFLWGVVIGILLLAGGVFVYFTSGMAPVAATAKPMPFERYLAGAALQARLNSEASKAVPMQTTPENLLAGAMIYKKRCAFCHGLPNSKPSEQGRGMFPHAPQFFLHTDIPTGLPPEDIYWMVRNGVRMTGMPSFGSSLTYQQMWQVTQMLRNADQLPPRVMDALTAASNTPAPAAGAVAHPAPAKHR
jgi:thiosulfate dehydrogenase